MKFATIWKCFETMDENLTLSSSASNNTNTTVSLGTQSEDAEVVLVKTVVLISVGILIVFENSVVLVAAFRNKTLRENIHYNLVLFLSFSDFVLGINAIIHGVIHIKAGFSIDAILTLCRLNLCLGSIAFLMSVWPTSYISLNRYLVISEKKLNQFLWNGKRKYIVYGAMWIAHLVLYVVKLSPKDEGGIEYEELCNPITMFGEDFAVWNTIFSVSIAISLLSTFVFYSLALFNVRERYRKTENHDTAQQNGAQQQMANRQRERVVKSMKLITIVLAVLVLSLCPTLALSFVFDMTLTENLVLICFSFFHSAANPIIYCIQIEDFKKEIQKMFNFSSSQTMAMASSL